MSAIDLRYTTKAPPVNASGTLADGNPRLLAKTVNVSRMLSVHNPGMTSFSISFLTNVPVLGGPGTITVAPGATWSTPSGFIPQGDFYIVGTAGQYFTAWYF